MKAAKKSLDIKKIGELLLILLCIVALFNKVILGFDIDEQYAISMSYRLFNGQTLIGDLWDPHQLSSVFIVPILSLVYKINGNFDNLVFMIRLFGFVIHIAVSVIIYVCFKKISNKYALFASLLYLLLLPKQTLIIEHSNIANWFITLTIISIYYYFKKKTALYAILSSLCYSLAVFAYPTLAVEFVLLIVILYKANTNKTHVLIFVLIPVTLGLLFIIYLVNQFGLNGLFMRISLILTEGSHQTNTVNRIMSDIVSIGRSFIPICVIAYILSLLVCKIKYFSPLKDDIFMLTLFFSACAYSLLIMHRFFFSHSMGAMIWNRRNLLLSILGIIVYVVKKRNKEYYMLLIPLTTGVICFLTSNQYVDSWAGYLSVSSAYSFILIVESLNNRTISRSLIILILSGQILATAFAIRISDTKTIRVNELVQNNNIGELNHIAITPRDKEFFESLLGVRNRLIGEFDRSMLFIGRDTMAYEIINAKVVAPLTISTPVYDKQWIEYYKIRKDKPKWILVDKEYCINNNIDQDNNKLLNYIDIKTYSTEIDNNYITLYKQR